MFCLMLILGVYFILTMIIYWLFSVFTYEVWDLTVQVFWNPYTTVFNLIGTRTLWGLAWKWLLIDALKFCRRHVNGQRAVWHGAHFNKQKSEIKKCINLHKLGKIFFADLNVLVLSNVATKLYYTWCPKHIYLMKEIFFYVSNLFVYYGVPVSNWFSH